MPPTGLAGRVTLMPIALFALNLGGGQLDGGTRYLSQDGELDLLAYRLQPIERQTWLAGGEA
jgi:hypothetical protein